MHVAALVLVLLSALLHAAWNAQLKSGKDQAQFMASMSLAVGTISLLFVPLVGLPSVRSWPCIALSGALHILYNFLLLQKYKNTDFSSAYPISRGVSPVLISLGALLFMHQHLALPSLFGVGLISCGILLQVIGKNRLSLPLTLPAFATGATIAAYTIVDTIGVQRSESTASYSVWVFASYLFTPALLRCLQFRIRLFDRASLPRAACAGVLSLIAYTVVLWATHYVAVGTVSALRETSVLWAAVIGRVFLGEELTRRKIGSAILICCGVILLVRSNAAKSAAETSSIHSTVVSVRNCRHEHRNEIYPEKSAHRRVISSSQRVPADVLFVLTRQIHTSPGKSDAVLLVNHMHGSGQILAVGLAQVIPTDEKGVMRCGPCSAGPEVRVGYDAGPVPGFLPLVPVPDDFAFVLA